MESLDWTGEVQEGTGEERERGEGRREGLGEGEESKSLSVVG